MAIASSTLFWMPRAMRSGATTSGVLEIGAHVGHGAGDHDAVTGQRLHCRRRAAADDVEARVGPVASR